MTAYAPYPGLGSQEALKIILKGLDAYRCHSKAAAIAHIKADLETASFNNMQQQYTDVRGRSLKDLYFPGT